MLSLDDFSTVIPFVVSSYDTLAPNFSLINLKGTIVVELFITGDSVNEYVFPFTIASLLFIYIIISESSYFIVTFFSLAFQSTFAPNASVITLKGTIVVPCPAE